MQEFGLSVMPGMHLNQGSLFLRFGLSKAGFKRTGSATNTSTRADNYKHYYSGAHVGLGYRVHLLRHLFLQADYIYTHYRMHSVLSSDGSTTRTCIRDNSSTALIGLFYQVGRGVNAAANAVKLHLDSFYVGMQGIMNMTSIHGKYATNVIVVDEKAGIHGGKLGMSVGYGHLFDRHFYLAAEISRQGFLNHFKYGRNANIMKQWDGLRYGSVDPLQVTCYFCCVYCQGVCNNEVFKRYSSFSS